MAVPTKATKHKTLRNGHDDDIDTFIGHGFYTTTTTTTTTITMITITLVESHEAVKESNNKIVNGLRQPKLAVNSGTYYWSYYWLPRQWLWTGGGGGSGDGGGDGGGAGGVSGGGIGGGGEMAVKEAGITKTPFQNVDNNNYYDN